MRSALLATVLAASAAVAVPSYAQNLGGQVGATVGVGVNTPSTAPLTGQVGQTLRGAGDLTRSTVNDARDLTRQTPSASVGANVGANAQTSVDRRDAGADLDVQAGAMVHGSDGGMLGSVVRTTRNTAGRVESLVVRSADGTLRSVPASGASVQGGVVVTGWSQNEFNRAPPM